MTSTDIATRTGVTLVLAHDDAAAFATLVRDVAERSGAESAAATGRNIGSFGFESGEQLAAVVAGAVDVAMLDENAQLAMLLGSRPASALRIEMMTNEAAREVAVKADAALVVLIVEAAKRFTFVALDDVGAIYDLDELRDLATRGLGRFESAAFLVEAARREERIDLDRRGKAANASAASRVERVLPVVGTRIPALTWIDALAEDRATVLGLALDDVDVDNLARFGVAYTATIDELDVAADARVDDRVRDELDLYCARRISAEDAQSLLQKFALARMVNATAARGATAPRLTILGEAVEGVAQPLAYASFGGTHCTVLLVDVARAGTRLGGALRSRGDVAALIGGDIGTIIALDLESADRPIDDEAMRAADAWSVAVAAAFAERFGTVATDMSGAVYLSTTIARLATRGSTRTGSWPARVANASATA